MRVYVPITKISYSRWERVDLFLAHVELPFFIGKNGGTLWDGTLNNQSHMHLI